MKNLFVFLILCLLSMTYGQDPNFHIYLAFGQSNMSGQADPTTADKTPNPRFVVLRAGNHSGQTVGKFYPGIPPMGHSGSKMGIADFFGRKIIQELPASIKVGVANISIGGQSIDLFDKATSASYITKARNAKEWWIQYLDEYGGNPYNRIIEMGEVAKREGVIKGILFHQGEADYQMANWPSRVKKVYEDIIADLKLDPTKVPILIGELATTAAGGDLGYRNTAVAEAANMIPNGHLISAAGCPALKEPSYTLHFTRAGYQTFGERYAEKMLELLGSIGGPIVELTASPAEVSVGETLTLKVNASTEKGSIVKVEIREGATLLEEKYSAPYTFVLNNLSLGSHQIRAIATDSEGKQGEASLKIQIRPLQTPYQGVAWAVPGKVEFEHYDECGNGCAYFDDSEGNEGGANFRLDEDVDLEDCSDDGGGYNLGWAKAGEWLEYTVNVQNPGTYNLVIRAASENVNTISIASNGVELVKSISIPNTGGWQKWQDVTVNDVILKEGIQVLRFTIGSDYVNLNYIDFKSASLSIQARNQNLNNATPQARLFYDKEKQSVFVRIEKNGKVQLIDVKGQQK